MRSVAVIQQTARHDLRSLSPDVARRVLSKIDALTDNLAGDVKRLARHSPAYRLRVGDDRVLFDVVDDAVLVQRVLHRSKAYD